MSGYSFLCVDEGGVLFGAVEVDRLASSEMQADFGRLIRICRPMVSREAVGKAPDRSEEHTSELQSLMRISYAVFCLKNKIKKNKSSKSTNNNKTIYDET